MYCSHFNLDKKPFQLYSDNSFLWLGQTHARALDQLNQGIEGRESLLVLTGDVGTGKTTLIHEIIQTLSPDTACAHITDPSLEIHHLFTAIAGDLGFESHFQSGQKFEALLIASLNRAEQRGRRSLIIIDEAHLIPGRFLVSLISWSRALSGHALTIILAGQLEFHALIEKTLGNAWKNIVDVHALLAPLDEKETRTYINQRLKTAGARRRIFLVPALCQAHRFSKGIPRRINIACDQAMIEAYSKGMKLIDAPTFQQALGILELPGPLEPPPDKKMSPPGKRLRPGRFFAGMAAAIALGWAVFYVLPAPPLAPQRMPVSGTDRKKPSIDTEILAAPAVQRLKKNDTIYDHPEKKESAEAYSPPEKKARPLDSGYGLPPDPDPVDMNAFIKEVFMITGSGEEPVPTLKKGQPLRKEPDPGAVLSTSPKTRSNSPPPRKKSIPDTDAIIDWLIQKKRG